MRQSLVTEPDILYCCKWRISSNSMCTCTPPHTHPHAHRDIQGFRGGALGGCVFFSSEENLTTIISTQVAADNELGYSNIILHVQGQQI